MAKLVVTQEGRIIQQQHLEEGERALRIGRDAGCALCLADAGVSREHAAIRGVGNDHILEDLGSGNGTRVNGAPISRHILQNRDVIEIGPYRIQYVNHRALESMDYDKTMFFQGAPVAEAQAVEADTLAATTRDARAAAPLGGLRGLAGRAAGDDIPLDDIIHTLGDPDTLLAAILRRPHGYSLMRVAGRGSPRVNGEAIGEAWRDLNINDVIEVGADRYTYYRVAGGR